MGHTPYGYRILDGKAVVDEEQAVKLRELYNGYISGLALTIAAEKVGLKMYHGSIGRMLRNRHYLGDDYYPSIIDQEMFDKAEEKRMEKVKSLGRVRELNAPPKLECKKCFVMPKVAQKYADPFKQAEYAYSLIESEVNDDGSK